MQPSFSLAVSAGLTWAMLVVASAARSRGWTRFGLKLALGNRDDMPAPSAFAARADRAAKNMLENLALFATLLLAASLAGVANAALAVPCAVFIYSRLVYAPLYWLGVKYVRTGVWLLSVAALAWIAVLVVRA